MRSRWRRRQRDHGSEISGNRAWLSSRMPKSDPRGRVSDIRTAIAAYAAPHGDRSPLPPRFQARLPLAVSCCNMRTGQRPLPLQGAWPERTVMRPVGVQQTGPVSAPPAKIAHRLKRRACRRTVAKACRQSCRPGRNVRDGPMRKNVTGAPGIIAHLPQASRRPRNMRLVKGRRHHRRSPSDYRRHARNADLSGPFQTRTSCRGSS